MNEYIGYIWRIASESFIGFQSVIVTIMVLVVFVQMMKMLKLKHELSIVCFGFDSKLV